MKFDSSLKFLGWCSKTEVVSPTKWKTFSCERFEGLQAPVMSMLLIDNAIWPHFIPICDEEIVAMRVSG